MVQGFCNFKLHANHFPSDIIPPERLHALNLPDIQIPETMVGIYHSNQDTCLQNVCTILELQFNSIHTHSGAKIFTTHLQNLFCLHSTTTALVEQQFIKCSPPDSWWPSYLYELGCLKVESYSICPIMVTGFTLQEVLKVPEPYSMCQNCPLSWGGIISQCMYILYSSLGILKFLPYSVSHTATHSC